MSENGDLDPHDTSFYERGMRTLERDGIIAPDCRYLVVFGAGRDRAVFEKLGYHDAEFTNVTPSQAGGEAKPIDATNLPFADESFDVVVAHAGIHHASRPHAAVCEMYRVARRAVIFFEAQDSWLMRLAVRAKLVADYEWNAIFDHDLVRGGVDDRPIPNYVYRWTRREVEKLVRVLQPEREPNIRFVSEWDFHYKRVARRLKRTPAGLLPDSLLEAACSAGVNLANAAASRHGNALCVCIAKGGPLKPWIVERDGELTFDETAVAAPE